LFAILFVFSFNLKAAVECEKAVQAIDVHRECKNCVVTFWVMSQFSHLQGVVQTFVIQLLFLGLTLEHCYCWFLDIPLGCFP
jgi:hypothetical protein